MTPSPPARGRIASAAPSRTPALSWPGSALLTACGWVLRPEGAWVLPDAALRPAELVARAHDVRAALAVLAAAADAEGPLPERGRAMIGTGAIAAAPAVVHGDAGVGKGRTRSLTPGEVRPAPSQSATPRAATAVPPQVPSLPLRPRSASVGPSGTRRALVVPSAASVKSALLQGVGGAPLAPAPAPSENAKVLAAAALAAAGPDAAVQLLRGAEATMTLQQSRVLELEAQVRNPL